MFQPFDLRFDYVGTDDIIARLGEARTHDESNISCSDY